MATFTNIHTAPVELPGVPGTKHARGYMLTPGASFELEDDIAARMMENPSLRIYVAGKLLELDGIEAPAPERKPAGSPVVIGAAGPVVVEAPEADEPEEGEEESIPSSRRKPRAKTTRKVATRRRKAEPVADAESDATEGEEGD